jgi:hypothetical protein
MRRVQVERVLLVGFIATLVMTMLIYAAPLLGMPQMDFAALLGGLFAAPEQGPEAAPAPGSNLWWIGMGMQFVHGSVIFPLIYAYLLYPILSGAPWWKGFQWGLILWVLSQAVVMPMLGMGYFSAKTPQPMLAVIGGFIGHAVYGILLGRLAGPRTPTRQQRRQAEPTYASRP